MAGVLRKVKWPDKLKNLSLLGQHVGTEAAALDLELKRLEIAKRQAELKRLQEPGDDDDEPQSIEVIVVDARRQDAEP
ncbi:hypothetical protein D9M69_651380 [compost metagenome]